MGQSADEADKPFIPSVERVRSAQVILHIGPPKTATTHIQYTIRRLHEDLLKAGYCYPSNSQKDLHSIGISLREGDMPGKILRDKVFGCLKSGKKLIFSTEKLSQTETEEGFRRIFDFFSGYHVHVIAAFRDPLSLSYSWYNQVLRDNRNVATFTEHLSHEFDQYRLRALSSALFNFQKLYGRENMTVIDFHGMLAAQKDPSYVFLCEILGVLCDAKYVASEGSHPSADLRPSYLFAFVRNVVSSLGCDFLAPRKAFDELTEAYEELDFTIAELLE
ncbi:hypothetical protein EON64_14940, partial [archaeon]